MNEVEQSDRDHLIRLRIALQILREVIPFGTLQDANLQGVTRSIAVWTQDLEDAVEDRTSPAWDGWIPVDRRKPEEGERVLFVYTETRGRRPDGKPWGPSVTVGSWDDPEGWYDDLVVGDGMRVTGVVSHWRPFPGLPGADREEDQEDQEDHGLTPAEIALSKIRGVLMAGGFKLATPDEAVNIVADLVRERERGAWRPATGYGLPHLGDRVLVLEDKKAKFGILRSDGWTIDGRHGAALGEITMWRPVPAVL